MINKIKNITKNIDFTIISCITLLLTYNLLILYSASNKDILIISKRLIHIIISYILMIYITINLNKQYYKNNAYLFYIICNILLLFVFINGNIIKGAQRWINLYFFKFQPSEIIKISIPIIINKILSDNNYKINNLLNLIYLTSITLIPITLIYIQPDLGTSILIILYLAIPLYLNGLNNKIIIMLTILGIVISPLIWKYMLHNYQKQRIITIFSNKNNNDLKKNGYHTYQSKIAIGSGGLYGKGTFLGTQSKFHFIPENKTDFIFTLIAEEHGFVGICLILLIYLILIIRSLLISINNNFFFNKILISNLIINFFIHILINIGMVIGILPVVGIPLPLMSYGGTSLLSTMCMFGIIMSLQNKNIY